MTDAEIEATSPPELRNLPDDFWQGARVVTPVTKEAISIRLDTDVVAFFRKAGPRYQSRINAVLRSYVDEMVQRERPRKSKRAM
jgi:uncharacterized protein (DUF4415 family)